MKRWPLVLLTLLLATAASAAPNLPMSDRLADLNVRDGRVVVEAPGGAVAMEPAEFVAAVAQQQPDRQRRGWLLRVLDVTSPLGMVWVGLGLLGQALFSGRMIVQWLASERAKQSVVPVSFWWMSLVGSSMLMAYFVWRVEVVGFLGQSAPWAIYARNLWLIYHPQPAAEPAPAA